MSTLTSAPAVGFRLSPQQRHLWRLELAEAPVRIQISLAREIEPSELEAALSRLVDRFEILRTTYTLPPGQRYPVQVIGEAGEVAWVYEDLRRVEPERRSSRLEAAAEAMAQPYDLTRRAALRATLLSVAADHHLLELALPALSADPGTMLALTGELASAIGGAAPGDDDELVQYVDYAEWQNELASSEEHEQERDFWHDFRLSVALGQRLPSERAEAVPFRSETLDLAVSATTAQALLALARRSESSLESVVLTAWQVLLWRYLELASPWVGLVAHGRDDDELAGVIGRIARTLPTRGHPEPEMPFLAFLSEVHEAVEHAREHQDYFHIDAFLRAEQIEPQKGFLPFVFELVQTPPSLEAGLAVVEVAGRHDRYRLGLVLVEDPDLEVLLDYDPSVFDAPHAAAIGRAMESLLDAVAGDPATRLIDLQLLDGATRERIAVDWNATTWEAPAQRSLHQMFEERAGELASRPALSFGRHVMSYGDLDRQANRLAHLLRDLGVGPEVPVAVCVERSLDMAVGVLAVLKSGGAYVALDPELPLPRLEKLLSGSGARCLLARDELAAALASWGGEVVRLDADADRWRGRSPSAPPNLTEPDHLAYIVFTSGTTGEPKAVLVPHRGAVSHLDFLIAEHGIGRNDRILQLASLAFDASVRDLLGPLCAGARVTITSGEDARDPAALLDLVARQEITVLPSVVPTLLRVLLEAAEGGGGTYPGVRRILTSGERLHRSDCESARRVFGPEVTIVNQYGPTECTLTSSFYRLDPGREIETDAQGTVWIGKPIANTRFQVLDERHQPVPVGMRGELFIGGVGVTRGYLGRPAATAERFLPEPTLPELAGVEPGGRVYRTGDLVRWLPDGGLVFLGRRDDQVKLRGYRIEPTEIEAVLRSHPQIQAAAVVAREDPGHELRLVAYVVMPAEDDEALQSVRSHLHQELPQYMLPAVTVALPALPLLPNGKVDRRALPAPEEVIRHRPPYVAPRSITEQLLTGIWAEVLDIERVGMDDDFFDLGGHSLLATQVLARAREVFQVEVPLQTIFESSSVSHLARAIDQRVRSASVPTRPSLEARPRASELPLSFPQQRLWFLNELDPDSPAYNISLPLTVRGRLDLARVAWSLERVVERHEMLRTSFHAVDGRPTQRIHATRAIRPSHVDLRALPEATRRAETWRLARAAARKPFDLERDPLLRVGFLCLGEDEWVALLTMHHIVSDEWSMAILVRELSAFYREVGEGRIAALPELTVQYADFALWQRDWLRDEILDEHLSFWKEHLANAPDQLLLPTDRPRPARPSRRPASRTRRIPGSLYGAVQRCGRRCGATPFMTVLTTFQALLSRLTGQRDLVVGTSVAGRGQLQTERLIGFFVSNLALRADLRGDPTVEQLLARTRSALLAAQAYQDLPFELLVEALDPERDLTLSPIFQVEIAFQNVPQESLSLPDLELAPLGLETAPAKFDLDLLLAEQDGDLRTVLRYDADLFDSSTVERWLRSFKILLEAMVENPARPWTALSCLSEAERHQSTVEWNDSAAELGTGFAHRQLEIQAAKTPDAVAAIDSAGLVSFAELNRRANRVAWSLIEEGIGPELVVAVLAERDTRFLAVLLGILKAGGTYLPLALDQPSHRLAHILEQSRAALLVVDPVRAQDPAPGPPTAASCRRVDLDALLDTPRQTDPAPRCRECHLAYVIYTSGSTGLPKGAMVEHRGLWNHLQVKITDLALTDRDLVAQNASQAFDVSIWQFLAALLVGGRVRIVSDDDAHEPARLLEVADRDGISILEMVPSELRYLLDELESDGTEPSRLATLRWLVPTGEALPPELCRRWFAVRPDVPLLNAYGPTECSDDVTHAAVRRHLPGARRTTIGRPVANLRLHVLDHRLTLLSAGTVGELWVEGRGVGRGYLADPTRTASSFVPNPFGQGDRLYRTGDLARWLADGSLDFLGRADHQVKIHGLRIELGEIEAAIELHPDVRQCAVLARADEAKELRLVAYVAGGTDPKALREHLRGRLSSALLPSAFIVLDALPLNASGKVDRRSLPAPSAVDQAQADFVAPRTYTEELLAAIWTETLEQDPISAHDDFFALGGHSLIATRMISRVRECFTVELPLRQLFEAPTLAGLAAAIDQASAGERPAMPAILPVSRQEALPLSFAQQRLWFLHQLEPESFTYNVPAAVRLQGRLEIGVLARVLEEIVRRHEVLRTRFAVIAGQPRQIVEPPRTQPLPLIDLADLSAEQRRTEQRRLAESALREPFHLEHDAVLRSRLLRLGADEHELLVVMHHIASDGWSMEILVREVFTLYQAFAAGRPSPLRELPVQYADYAVWQRQWLSGEVLAELLAYWRAQLTGLPPQLALPTDRPWPVVRSPQGALRSFRLSATLAGGLARLARRERVTMFMVLTAAFQALLHRYSGQPTFAVGTPIAGRTRLETEGLIGFLVNTLVLRADFSDEPTLRHLMLRTRDIALESHRHQDLPFEKLVEELQPERVMSHSPLFQALLVYQNTSFQSLPQLSNLEVEWVPLQNQTAKFELVAAFSEAGDELAGSLLFSTDLFEGVTIERMVRHFKTLLEGMTADIDQSTAAVPLLQASERRELVAAGRRAAHPATACLGELFAQRAAQTPDSIAVVAPGQALTYGRLAARAARIARRLRRAGAGPETIVGLCADRGLARVEGILGILAAGAAYLPLRIDDPAERRAFMLQDSRANLLLAEDHLAEKLVGSSAELIRLEDAAAEDEAAGWPAISIVPEHPAYVIYTSGSTGQPKGVVVTHANVCRLFRVCEERFEFSAADVWTLFHSYAFDFSVWEIWGALLYGGRLVVVPYLVSRSPEAFADLLLRERVTLLSQTPSAFRQLIPALAEVSETPLRRVIFGGEALELSSLRPWLERRGDTTPRLVNMYGITETTVHVTWYELTRSDIERSNGNGIGVALPDLSVQVLDRRLEPVPPGIVGEMFVAGEGLARGYLARPGLTAERFLPDVLSGEAGRRIYRTGDLGRQRGDGQLEYVGRGDHQVKIRGFRIEVGEIEATIVAHPRILEAVVLKRQLKAGDERLVAYCVTLEEQAPGQVPDTAELISFLRRRLTTYMVPSDFVYLDALPLTRNGKVDRLALPEPDAQPSAAERIESQSPIEESLAGLWAHYLQTKDIGRNTSFFDLGGHSLLATQLLARVRQRFGVDLPLRDFFKAPTLAAQAADVERALGSPSGACTAPPITSAGARDSYPLSFSQERMWVLQSLNPTSAAFNIFQAMSLEGPMRPEVLERSLEVLIVRHDALRTRLVEIDGLPRQIVDPPGSFLLPMVDLSGIAPDQTHEELDALAAAEARCPFHLSRGPLMRALLVRQSERQHAAFLSLHHAIADGWSLEVLQRELVGAYAALNRCETPALPDLPMRFVDFAAWQRSWMQEEALERELAYWRRQLGGEIPVLELPMQRKQPTEPSFRGAIYDLDLSVDLVPALEALRRQDGVTLYMILLAAFKALLHLYTGEQDIVVGTNIANRNRAETEGLIGFLANNLALRTEVSGDSSFRELLRRVADVALAGFMHQDVPYEKVLEALGPRYLGSYSSLFQVMFVFQHAESAPNSLGELTVRPLKVHHQNASFNLLLTVVAGEGHLSASITYDTDLFDHDVVSRLGNAYCQFLSSIVEDPDRPLSSILSPPAKSDASLLESFNEEL